MAADWDGLNRDVGGQLIKIEPPLAVCQSTPDGADCTSLFKELKNPYFINANPGLTQTTGWLNAWTSSPSAYAVAARKTEDVVAAVKFARTHNLRLVVKGGGHSYQGTSSAPDSLLIWTHPMDAITMHDAFVADGCRSTPQPAVTVEAGAIWMHVYNAVTTGTGRYVQGGGCATVGVAGLIQSGGFGSFSKNFGTAASGLLQAEIVTADGTVRIANACTNPDLFWALKGGGGGTFGVVTRLTLQTHDLPEYFGVIALTLQAKSDATFRSLIARFIAFYQQRLFNPHWGESVTFGRDNTLDALMVFQGLDQAQAVALWTPFINSVTASAEDVSIKAAPAIIAVPARDFWNPAYLVKNFPGFILRDNRPGASADNVFWAGNLHETGWFLHNYQSTWLPAALLRGDRQHLLADALFAATRHWHMALHFNKGLAGAPKERIVAARNTATNPAVLDAFALAISAASGPPAFPGVPGHEPDQAMARQEDAAVRQAMDEMRKLVPVAGSYVSESDYFDRNWQRSFWGTNYKRLQAVKQKYDPAGLFFVHHGVGSEAWSADGFQRV